MEIDKNWPVSWMEDVGVTCTECGKVCVIKGHFTEVAGDERLNFYKVRLASSHGESCPHCGNEIKFVVTYWKREFMGMRPDGREVCRIFTMWERLENSGCGGIFGYYNPIFGYYEESGPEDHSESLALNTSKAHELIDLLYKTTHDEELLAIAKSLEQGDSVESVIPELMQIIDTYDDILKDAYLGDYLP